MHAGGVMSNERELVKVSRMFYLDSLSQKEISEKLGISRPQVCRMLQEARNRGIVKITIDSPFDREDYLAEKLERLFGLRTVYVYKTPDAEGDESFYEKSARDLVPALKKFPRIAVMSGRTLWGIARMLPDTVKTGNSFVPLAGISGSRGQSFQANEIAREMAVRVGGAPSWDGSSARIPVSWKFWRRGKKRIWLWSVLAVLTKIPVPTGAGPISGRTLMF